jgi:hypothetical protein
MLIEVSLDLAIDDTTRIAVNHELFDKLRCLADYYLRRRCYEKCRWLQNDYDVAKGK